MSLPLVSAIMPTANRPELARQAAEMFLAQDYPLCELVVIDDGEREARLPESDQILFQWFPFRRNVGQKRNLACGMAAGEIILHWDDDDIYDPHRITDQVERLLAHPDAEMTGYRSMEFMSPDGARWQFDGPERYAIGVSMCYWKRVWQARPFPSVNSGEDLAFWQGRKCVAVPADGMITARIHRGNTSFKDTSQEGWRRVA